MRSRPIVRLVLSAVFLACAFHGPSHATPQDPPPPARDGNAPDHPPEELEKIGAEIMRAEAERTRREDLDAAGLPETSEPFVLTLKQAYELAVIKARTPLYIPTGLPVDGWIGPDAKPFDAEALKKAAEKYHVADFERFRNDFLQRSEFRDPSAGFFRVLALRNQIRNIRETIAHLTSLTESFKEVNDLAGDPTVLNETSQTGRQLRITQSRLTLDYRNALDDLKVQLGLPVETPLLLNDAELEGYEDAARRFETWLSDADRQPETLSRLVESFPELPDVTINGRSLREASKQPSAMLDPLLRDAATIIRKRVQGAPWVESYVHNARQWIRALLQIHESYSEEQRLYLSHANAFDNALRLLFAPPGAVKTPPDVLTLRLVTETRACQIHQEKMISLWISYQSDRLSLALLLHQMPGDDWDSFLAPFQARAAEPPKGP